MQNLNFTFDNTTGFFPGYLSLPKNPVDDTHLVNKNYVDTLFSKLSHSSLKDLLEDVHPQYLSATVPKKIKVTHTFDPPENKPSFFLSPNAKKESLLIKGLNSELLYNKPAVYYLDRGNHTGKICPEIIEPQGAKSGLDSDTVDGKHASDFARFSHSHKHSDFVDSTEDVHSQYLHLSNSRTITVQHIFNSSVVQSPFILGQNCKNQLVSGLNSEQLDGHMFSEFVLNSGGKISGHLVLNKKPELDKHAANKEYVDSKTPKFYSETINQIKNIEHNLGNRYCAIFIYDGNGFLSTENFKICAKNENLISLEVKNITPGPWTIVLFSK